MSASGGMSSMSCTPENSLHTGPAHDMNIFREAVVQLTRRNYGLPGSGLSAGTLVRCAEYHPYLRSEFISAGGTGAGRGLAAPNKAGRIVCKHSYPHARFIDNLPTVRSYNSHLRTMAGISC